MESIGEGCSQPPRRQPPGASLVVRDLEAGRLGREALQRGEGGAEARRGREATWSGLGVGLGVGLGLGLGLGLGVGLGLGFGLKGVRRRWVAGRPVERPMVEGDLQ